MQKKSKEGPSGLSKKRLKKRGIWRPRQKDYVWRLLGKICEDLTPLSDLHGFTPDLLLVRAAIRERDVAKYITFCQSVSLPQLNKRMGKGPLTLTGIRCLRLLTCARKYIFPDSPYDPEGKAVEKFLFYEEHCRTSNNNPLFWELLSDDESPTLSNFDSLYTWRILQFAREFIGRVCGDEDPTEEIFLRSYHGPGASVGCRGQRAIPINKYYPPLTAIDSAQDLVLKWVEGDERWMTAAKLSSKPMKLSVESCAALDTVPKSAEIKRFILLECTGNVALQLGVGSLLKSRLSRFGIDISTQKKNQQLARLYSKGGGVTVDLSGASDTVALSWLVFFPPRWAELLYALRSPVGSSKRLNLTVTFEKLSSMGNGYTFAIETLIFSALLYGVVHVSDERWSEVLPQISVYGDDIVLPERFFPLYATILKKMGFVLNTGKTFHTGRIRESCGEDFYDGFPIRCFSLSDKISNRCDCYTIHNSLLEFEETYDICVARSRDYVVEELPVGFRCWGPITEERNSHLFTRDKALLDIYRSTEYQCLMVRYKSSTISHPKIKMRVTRKIIGHRWGFFLPLVQYCNRNQKDPTYDPTLLRRAQRIKDRLLDRDWLKNLPTREFSICKPKKPDTLATLIVPNIDVVRSSMKAVPWHY